MRFIMIAIVLCFLPLKGQASGEGLLELNLAKDSIDITTGFSGEYLEVFGLKPEGDGELVVVVKGPDIDVLVRRKDNVMGGWINRSSLVFENVSSFHRVAATDDPKVIASLDVLDKHEISLENSRFMTREAVDMQTFDAFKAGLIREKIAADVFAEGWQSLDLLNDKFFRASFYFPDNLEFGDYLVEALYFEDGELLQRATKSLRVEQVGMSAKIQAFSRDIPWLYGVLCVFLALYTGWFSHKLRQRF